MFTPALMERDGLIVETHYHVVQPGPVPGSSDNNVRSRPIKPLPDAQGVKPAQEFDMASSCFTSDAGRLEPNCIARHSRVSTGLRWVAKVESLTLCAYDN